MTRPPRSAAALLVVPEKDVQDGVKQLYTAIGCRVRSTSQYRASHIAPGIPDLHVTHLGLGVMFWHEVKGRSRAGALKSLSEAQARFQRDCELCRVPFVWGGVQEAQAFLVSVGLAKLESGTFTLTPKGKP